MSDNSGPSEPRHPTGLWILAAAETWERFSFYGVRALLVLYLTSGALDKARFDPVHGSSIVLGAFGTPSSEPGEANVAEVQALSSQINEWYSGLAYLTPLAGGVFADRLFGVRNTCILGGVLMALGHLAMAYDRLLLLGLLFLILGNGGFKSTISAQLGHLYEAPGPTELRESGFALFYCAINLGALLAPLVCGELQERVSFHAGFGAAGVGMLVGLAVYIGGARHLPAELGRRRLRRESETGTELESLRDACERRDTLDSLPTPPREQKNGTGRLSFLPLSPLASPHKAMLQRSRSEQERLDNSGGGGGAADGSWATHRAAALCGRTL